MIGWRSCELNACLGRLARARWLSDGSATARLGRRGRPTGTESVVSGRAYDATGLPTLSSSWGTVSNASWLPGVNMPVTDTTQIASALDQGGYQALANVTSCTSADGTLNYSYDADGQLIGVATNGTTTATYNWDANGNPSNFDANGNPAGTSYVIANDNELLYDGTYRYAYDGEGNCVLRFKDPGDIDTIPTGFERRHGHYGVPMGRPRPAERGGRVSELFGVQHNRAH